MPPRICAESARRFLSYYLARGELPPTCIRGEGGEPLLSGRVLLLPYLGARGLFDKIDRREAWDSPHNRAAVESSASWKLPFRCHATWGHDDLQTSYVFVLDCGLRAPDGDYGEAIEGLPPDKTNSIMMMEVPNWRIEWTQPADATPADIRRLLAARGLYWAHYYESSVLFRDGRVATLPSDVLEKLIGQFMGAKAGVPVQRPSPAGTGIPRGAGSARRGVRGERKRGRESLLLKGDRNSSKLPGVCVTCSWSTAKISPTPRAYLRLPTPFLPQPLSFWKQIGHIQGDFDGDVW